jgi:hypothetical protein
MNSAAKVRPRRASGRVIQVESSIYLNLTSIAVAALATLCARLEKLDAVTVRTSLERAQWLIAALA